MTKCFWAGDVSVFTTNPSSFGQFAAPELLNTGLRKELRVELTS